MRVVFVNQSSKPLPRAFFSRWLEYLHKQLQQKGLWVFSDAAELAVVLLPVQQATELNRQFRGRSYATDVLSFAGDGSEMVGELVLCPEVVQRQAKEHGLSFRDEAAYLLLHGLLHLLGFEHEAGGRQAEEMYQLQDNLFADIDKIK